MTNGLQYQYCFRTTAGDQCTGLDGHVHDPEEVGTAFQNTSSVQLSALKLLIASARRFTLILNSEKLLESWQQGNLITKQVPPDQCIIETRAMEAAVWSALQVSLSDYAIGPSIRSPEQEQYISKPNTTGDMQLYHSQRMRKAGGFV